MVGVFMAFIRVVYGRMIYMSLPTCAQYVAEDPISLHADSEDSLLGAQFILLVLSCRGSYVN